jgi:hypothetical protein
VGSDVTRVDPPDDDDEEVASSLEDKRELARPTEARPAVGRTAWDLAYAVGATEHTSRVLRELDPVEVIAVVAYGYVLWARPQESPGFLIFLGAVAGYHLALRPLARFGQVWLFSKMQRIMERRRQ